MKWCYRCGRNVTVVCGRSRQHCMMCGTEVDLLPVLQTQGITLKSPPPIPDGYTDTEYEIRNVMLERQRTHNEDAFFDRTTVQGVLTPVVGFSPRLNTSRSILSEDQKPLP